MSISKKCSICLCADSFICVCDISHMFCKPCFTQYLETTISDATYGICPVIVCPFSHTRRPIIQYDIWSTFVSPAILFKYNQLAKSVLSILCGKCHKLDNLMVDFDTNASDSVHSFSSGKISVNDFYDSFDSTQIYSILKSISNPERRASLHLRFLKDNPCIFTTCCNSEHCFQCRVKPYHHNQKCEVKELDNTIVICPDCSLRLTKGDGCNHVSCICGCSFDWEKEKELSNKCRVFETQFPENTFDKCVEILCAGSDLVYAKAWRKKHLTLIDKKIYEWFKQYSPYPSKVCANLYSEKNTYGVKIAIKLWYRNHAAEVDKYITMNRHAVRSIFNTFYPSTSDKTVALYRTFPIEKINESMDMWMKDLPKNFEISNTISFLYLYGKYTPREIKMDVFQPVWNTEISNPHLTYTNQNTTVERKGDVSCYPAVFSSVMNSISVRIDHLPISNNIFSFGITTHLKHSYSNDVGKSIETWGIMNGFIKSYIQAQGVCEKTFRCLETGDVLSFHFVQGWFELSVNHVFVHRFYIPTGPKYYTIILANDNKVTILNEVKYVQPMHPEHSYLYASFIKTIDMLHFDVDIHNSKVDDFIKRYSVCEMDESISVTSRSESWGEIFTYLYLKQKNRSLQKKVFEMERANKFLESFGEDACFIAANRLQNYYSSPHLSSDDSLLFMNIFPEKQNDWYLNQTIIENIAANCKCLPRHLNVCPC